MLRSRRGRDGYFPGGVLLARIGDDRVNVIAGLDRPGHG
jgi:hypothetical protein